MSPTLSQNRPGGSKLARSFADKERRMVRAFFQDRIKAASPGEVTTNRTAVEASLFRSIGYHLGTRTLEVEFHGGVYQYQNVSIKRYQAFLDAADKDAFFKEEISPHHYCQRSRRR